MKLSQMQYFSAVCHAGNITRAAEELHISQPSITASIKALEAELGVSLLHRGKRIVTPTPDGERFLSKCDAILANIRDLEQEFGALKERHKTLSIGIPPMIGSFLFPELFSTFYSKHPDIYLKPCEMGSEVAKEAVISGELDLAVITMGTSLSGRLDCITLSHSELAYCVGADHPLASRGEISLREIERDPVILFSGGYYHQKLLETTFRSLNITPNILFHSNQFTTIKSFIRNNLAGGFLMPQVIQPEDRIVPLHVTEGLPLNVAMIWRKDDYITKEAERFIAFCRQAFEKPRLSR